MEEGKAAAAAATSKPNISSDETFDEIEEDNSKETGSPSAQIEESDQPEEIEEEKAAVAKLESSSEEIVDQIECDRPMKFQKTPTKIKRASYSEMVSIETMSMIFIGLAKAAAAKLRSSIAAQRNKTGSVSNKNPEYRIQRRRLLHIGVIAGLGSVQMELLQHNFDKQLSFLKLVLVLSLLTSLFISMSIAFLDVMNDFVLYVPLLFHISIFGFARGPAIVMVAVQVGTHFDAAFLGYALAQRRILLKGKDIDKFKIATPNNEEIGRLRVRRMVAKFIHALLNLGVVLRLAWVLSHQAHYTSVDLMMHLLLPLIGGLLFWITFIVVSLGEAFIGDDGLTFVVLYFFFIMLNYILMVVTWGHAVATLATWFAALSLSGFLGYSIRIYNSLRVTKDLGSQVTS